MDNRYYKLFIGNFLFLENPNFRKEFYYFFYKKKLENFLGYRRVAYILNESPKLSVSSIISLIQSVLQCQVLAIGCTKLEGNGRGRDGISKLFPFFVKLHGSGM